MDKEKDFQMKLISKTDNKKEVSTKIKIENGIKIGR